jgi:hypothetical protein
MTLYRTPGKSFTRPPRIRTTECSCIECPSPGIDDVTTRLLDRRSRATFREAELGFFGEVSNTFKQTPRFCGFCCKPIVLDFRFLIILGFFKS